jgi:predicted ester cyclase
MRVSEEDKMKAQITQDGSTPKKTFLDIPNAAGLAGFSVRHFRRIIEEERIRVLAIGRKFFILSADFDRWQLNNQRKVS